MAVSSSVPPAVVLAVFLALFLAGCESQTFIAQTSTIIAIVPSSSAPMIKVPETTTDVQPTATSLPPEPPKPRDRFSFTVIRKWISRHPTTTGLSAAVIVLSVLLMCMCYLWMCKRRKHIIYYAVEIEEEEEEEGEIHCNPDTAADGPDTAAEDPDTEDDIDSGICGDKRSSPTGRPSAAAAGARSPASPGASAEVLLELKAVQAAANTAPGEETTGEPEPSDAETLDAGTSRSERGAEAYEEIPTLDSLSIDWPLSASDLVSPALTHDSGSLALT